MSTFFWRGKYSIIWGLEESFGPVAHLVERSIRIAEVESSSLFRSTFLQSKNTLNQEQRTKNKKEKFVV